MGTQYERLLEAMKQTGATWDDVRTAAKLTRAGIKKWRDGNFKRLTTQSVFTLSDLFKCNPRWLALGEGDAFPELVEGLVEVRSVWMRANTEGRQAMVEHARYVASQARFLEHDDVGSNGDAVVG